MFARFPDLSDVRFLLTYFVLDQVGLGLFISINVPNYLWRAKSSAPNIGKTSFNFATFFDSTNLKLWSGLRTYPFLKTRWAKRVSRINKFRKKSIATQSFAYRSGVYFWCLFTFHPNGMSIASRSLCFVHSFLSIKLLQQFKKTIYKTFCRR